MVHYKNLPQSQGYIERVPSVPARFKVQLPPLVATEKGIEFTRVIAGVYMESLSAFALHAFNDPESMTSSVFESLGSDHRQILLSTEMTLVSVAIPF
jgi:hypothetical protein